MSDASHINTEVSYILSWLIAFVAFVMYGYAKAQSVYLVPALVRRSPVGRQ